MQKNESYKKPNNFTETNTGTGGSQSHDMEAYKKNNYFFKIILFSLEILGLFFCCIFPMLLWLQSHTTHLF